MSQKMSQPSATLPDSASLRPEAVRTIQRAIDVALRRLLGTNDPDTDDIRQEALEAVVCAVIHGRFRSDCSMMDWAAAIARNVATDLLRRRSRARQIFVGAPQRGDDDYLEIADERGADDIIEARDDMKRIDRILTKLGPFEGRIVYLHDVLGHNLDEVARMVGISVTAAQSRLVRARKKIIRSFNRS